MVVAEEYVVVDDVLIVDGGASCDGEGGCVGIDCMVVVSNSGGDGYGDAVDWWGDGGDDSEYNYTNGRDLND
ncbi:hypothetical protein HAX54_031574 [Datura stramonium]|uniref:Uncharacterized protein n=1 Tax=Datura stramonium TaxID=4076 RepID=A0ABS8RND4_DATST|nr:hypothetical protein [Datura stramonium]